MVRMLTSCPQQPSTKVISGSFELPVAAEPSAPTESQTVPLAVSFVAKSQLPHPCAAVAVVPSGTPAGGAASTGAAPSATAARSASRTARAESGPCVRRDFDRPRDPRFPGIDGARGVCQARTERGSDQLRVRGSAQADRPAEVPAGQAESSGVGS